MRGRLVTIDDSRYLVIPEELLNETGIAGEVFIEVQGNSLVIRPAKNHRTGWTQAFQAMHENGDDALLDAEELNRYWDEMEGRW